MKDLKVDIKKFDQCKEVRNLNVPHNRDNFINLSVIEVLINNNIIDEKDSNVIMSSEENELKEFLLKKIKNVYQFEFLKSSYFRNWLRDPIKIFEVKIFCFNIYKIRKMNQKIKIAKNSLTILKIFLNPTEKTTKDTKNFFYILHAISFFIFKTTP
jgi:hypothetical protein